MTIKAGSTVICTVTLNAAKGTCTLATGKLKTGSYAITGTYSGNANFLPSVSGKKTLRITN